MNVEWWYIPLIILPTLPNLWSIWHVWAHEFSSLQEKIIWLLIPVFIPLLGGLVYIAAGRKKALGPVVRTQA
ncbi:MAG: PLDc N-terminal domain-containing protein [Desulfovibrionaceae bacterium]|nr:PLDc N-terminal domain-containing protein [Desulfovibrionaceae bacterium]